MVNGLLWRFITCGIRFWHYSARIAARPGAGRDRDTAVGYRGLLPGALLLAGMILTVALLDPGKPLPGTVVATRGFICARWCSWSLAALSLGVRRGCSRDNGFNYGAIQEVAVLFLGIFVCISRRFRS